MTSKIPATRKWQRRTITSLLVGYAGYYLCRSNLSVAAPLLLDEFSGKGLNKETLGLVASVGTTIYAVGKMFNGVLCDFLNGRRMFLLGMAGSVLCTVLFGMASGVGVFLVAWAVNRLFQSMGWVSLVKVTSNWFSFDRYGRVMAALCLSFLFGDAVARLFLGELVHLGLGWRGVFFGSAGVFALILAFCFFTLKSSPREVGLEEPEVNPNNLFGARGGEAKPEGVKELLSAFLRSASFWMVVALSLGMTLIRETFYMWTPTYLTEVGRLSPGAAAGYSLLYPLFGGLSVMAVGYVSDRYLDGKRGGLIVAAMGLLLLLLLAMSRGIGTGATMPLLYVSLAGFLMMGPYSLLCGVMSLDFGGKRGSATAAGLIDGSGYLGGVLSGYGVGAMADRSGWNAAFGILAGVAFLTTLLAGVYWRLHERKVVI